MMSHVKLNKLFYVFFSFALLDNFELKEGLIIQMAILVYFLSIFFNQNTVKPQNMFVTVTETFRIIKNIWTIIKNALLKKYTTAGKFGGTQINLFKNLSIISQQSQQQKLTYNHCRNCNSSNQSDTNWCTHQRAQLP